MEQDNMNNSTMNQGRMSRHLPSDQVQRRPMLGFIEAVKICFMKSFEFKGRARRSELWWFVLFTVLLGLASKFLDHALYALFGFEFVKVLSDILIFIPGMAVIFRRMHDVGHSGWWAGAFYLLVFGDLVVSYFVPWCSAESLVRASGSGATVVAIGRLLSLVLSLVVLAFTLYDSDVEDNKYGASPKYYFV